MRIGGETWSRGRHGGSVNEKFSMTQRKIVAFTNNANVRQNQSDRCAFIKKKGIDINNSSFNKFMTNRMKNMNRNFE